MFLYKLEIELADKKVSLIVIADTDERAFDYVEGYLVREYMVKPEIKMQAIVEKKRVDKGAGFLIEG